MGNCNCNGCPSAGTCQPESKPAPESDEMFEQPESACVDCLHFDYVRMDPYCKLKGQVVEHDFHCGDFALPLPKIAGPNKKPAVNRYYYAQFGDEED
jgi:hypothetical protein